MLLGNSSLDAAFFRKIHPTGEPLPTGRQAIYASKRASAHEI